MADKKPPEVRFAIFDTVNHEFVRDADEIEMWITQISAQRAMQAMAGEDMPVTDYVIVEVRPVLKVVSGRVTFAETNRFCT